MRVRTADEWLAAVTAREEAMMEGDFKYPEIKITKNIDQRYVRNIYKLYTKDEVIGYGPCEELGEKIGLSRSAVEMMWQKSKKDSNYWHRKGYRVELHLSRAEQIANRK